MINKDRIVPIQRVDWLTVVGTMLRLNGVQYAVMAADDVDGNYTIETASTQMLCNQPVRSIAFGATANTGNIYFVADYAFEGFTKGGTAMAISGNPIIPDGVTLYKGILTNSTTINITAMSPVAE